MACESRFTSASARQPVKAGSPQHQHGGLVPALPMAGAMGEQVLTVAGSAQIRQRDVLLLHAGDFNQGSSYFTELGGEMEVKLVNALGYDCVALGNHEFDNGLPDLAGRLAQIKCPAICANYDFSGTPLDSLVQPCAVFERAGRKIGVVGITSNLATMVASATSKQLTPIDNSDAVNRWASYLKASEACDIVILLSHAGYEEDIKLVPTLRSVDYVIGGHSHTFIDEPKVVKDADGKDVPIVTDGCFGIELAELTIR